MNENDGWVALPLVVAVVAQLSAQLVKTILHSVRARRIDLSHFVSAGGFPSAHSAFVSALVVAFGLSRGWRNDAFAVAAVLAAITIFDAYRLRGEVQRHAVMLNRLTADRPEYADGQRLSERIGHTRMETAAGMGWGCIVAVAVHMLVAA